MRRNFGYGLTPFRGMGATAADTPAGYVPNSAAATDYLARYSDLNPNGTVNDAWQHYVNHGMNEGRRWDFTKNVPVAVVLPTASATIPSTIFGVPSSYLLIAAVTFFLLKRKSK